MKDSPEGPELAGEGMCQPAVPPREWMPPGGKPEPVQGLPNLIALMARGRPCWSPLPPRGCASAYGGASLLPTPSDPQNRLAGFRLLGPSTTPSHACAGLNS